MSILVRRGVIIGISLPLGNEWREIVAVRVTVLVIVRVELIWILIRIIWLLWIDILLWIRILLLLLLLLRLIIILWKRIDRFHLLLFFNHLPLFNLLLVNVPHFL